MNQRDRMFRATQEAKFERNALFGSLAREWGGDARIRQHHECKNTAPNTRHHTHNRSATACNPDTDPQERRESATTRKHHHTQRGSCTRKPAWTQQRRQMACGTTRLPTLIRFPTSSTSSDRALPSPVSCVSAMLSAATGGGGYHTNTSAIPHAGCSANTHRNQHSRMA